MALLSSIVVFASEYILGLIVVGVLIHLTRNYFTPGAVTVPGPFTAKLSNIWRFVDVARGRPDITLYELHNKYGDYVRIGPNIISVRNPDVLKTIYGINKGFRKVRKTNPKCYPSKLVNSVDKLLSCPTATCQWKTDTDSLHNFRRRLPCGDQASGNIGLFNEYID